MTVSSKKSMPKLPLIFPDSVDVPAPVMRVSAVKVMVPEIVVPFSLSAPRKPLGSFHPKPPMVKSLEKVWVVALTKTPPLAPTVTGPLPKAEPSEGAARAPITVVPPEKELALLSVKSLAAMVVEFSPSSVNEPVPSMAPSKSTAPTLVRRMVRLLDPFSVTGLAAPRVVKILGPLWAPM